MAFALVDVSLAQAFLVAATAFGAAIVGGVTGYGTGLLLPLALIPVIGAEATVPVIAVSALFTNTSRVIAQWREVDWQAVRLMLPLALPCTMLTAAGFALLDARGAMIAVGAMLVAIVPARYTLMRAGLHLSGRGLVVAGGVYGLVTGGTSGAGVILVSILLAAGLSGPAVVATDAAISVVIGLVKASTFRLMDALPGELLVFAILVGCATFPGAFVAKALLQHLSARVHTAVLDGVVLIGGAMLLVRGLGIM